ncbi:MAG: primosomal protein N' [Acidobacteria bacterium]|nr:primosomal protein N' [Acidobacteriota bacterium]
MALASQRSKTETVRFVEVALPVPLHRVFTYSVPSEGQLRPELGLRVRVPFGKRNLIGFVVAVHAERPADLDIDPKKVRPAIEFLDDEPLITPEILRLTEWTADYYASFWGETLKAALPAGMNSEKVRPKRRKAVRLLDPELADNSKALTTAQSSVVETLNKAGGEMLWTDLLDAANVGASPINTLVKRRFLEVFVQDIHRDPLSAEKLPERPQIALTEHQKSALGQITDSIDESEFKAFLLHGVTGSGKTEVYFRAIRHTIAMGRSALMLVPEIALTPVFSRQLRAAFGPTVAILHSGLSQGERFDEWRRIRAGEARVAIGTRSAVFAPLKDLGLVIVDEEHDPAYRQWESPFYNARDVAVMRANFAGAVAVLGSATPAMESFHNAKHGKYTLLSMPERIGGRNLASAELVDMRDVFKREGKDVALSRELLEAIAETASKGEQIIVLMNRRGFAQFVLCRSCGETIKCENCDITLTFHRRDGRLTCHYCGYGVPAPRSCPKCESEFLYFVGEGTENLADQLEKKFPSLKIERIDRDSITRKGELEQKLLDFAEGRIDMLVGTQMIAKGHDFPNVTLVGVVGVDIGLGLPDLRSAERTFQMITQVAGRSGRGEKPGRVVIQTYHPDHYALQRAMAQDYEGFYADELKFRENFRYPPFVALASIMVRHRELSRAKGIANALRRHLDPANPSKTVRIVGPASASIARLKNEYRMQMILRSESRRELRKVLDIGLSQAEEHGVEMRFVFVEIDPVSLM